MDGTMEAGTIKKALALIGEALALIEKALALAIRIYRGLISPFLGNNCRFYPSCSCYAETAIKNHGAIVGSWMAMRRLARCHPWHPGGIDLVPDSIPEKKADKLPDG